jgi:hypothetical protein
MKKDMQPPVPGTPDADGLATGPGESLETQKTSVDFDDETPTVVERNPTAELVVARKLLASKQADLRKYQGLVGELRTKLTGAGEKKSAIEEEVALIREKYEQARAEVIGEDVMGMLDETATMTGAMAEAVAEKKGLTARAFEAIRNAHKKLGEYNLEKLGWHPEGRIAKMVARGVNARLLVNGILVGGGTAFGGTAAALGAITARRIFGGMSAGYGSFDFMSMLSERKGKKAALEGLESDTTEGLVHRLEDLEARALVNGKDLSQDETYQKLKAEFGKRFGGQAIAGPEGEAVQLEREVMLQLMSQKQERVDALQEMHTDRATAMKLAATGIGLLAGSGLIAKGVMKGAKGAWHATFGSAQPVEAAVVLPNGDVAVDSPELDHLAPRVEDVDYAAKLHPAVEDAVPADAAHPSVEGAAAHLPETPNAVDAEALKLAEIHKGDGVIRIVSRQLEAKPEAWGYDAAKDGDLHKWASKMTHELMAKNKISGDIRLKLDAAHPGHVLVSPDGKIEMSDAKTYMAEPHAATLAEEPHAAAASAESHAAVTAEPHAAETTSDIEARLDQSMDRRTDEILNGTSNEEAALDRSMDARAEEILKGAPQGAAEHATTVPRPTVGHVESGAAEASPTGDPNLDKIVQHSEALHGEHDVVDRALKTLDNAKLTSAERFEALKAACPEGKGINIESLHVSQEGGKMLAKIGRDVVVVTPKNVGAFSKFVDLLKEGQRAAVDPEGYKADLDQVVKELGLVSPDAAK